MAEIDLVGRTLILNGTHLESDGGPQSIGVANLRAVAAAVLEWMDCDEARIEGAPRTTGANPGLKPRALRFTLRSDSST
jgi:hypothetical protein